MFQLHDNVKPLFVLAVLMLFESKLFRMMTEEESLNEGEEERLPESDAEETAMNYVILGRIILSSERNTHNHQNVLVSMLSQS
ncbi:hypothetical protein Trydic_g6201 [Trypoxylus dichotomus]